jgi:hypothetical protein
MTRECSFILSTGRKCHGAANHNQALCRHHMPKPAHPGPPPAPKSERYSRIARWARLGRSLPWLDAAEIPSEIFNILYCLIEDGEGGISDHEAGRLLRGLLRRIGSVPFAIPDPSAPDPSAASAPSASSEAAHSAPASVPAEFLDPGAFDPGYFDPERLDSLLASLAQRYPVFEAARLHLQQTRPSVPQSPLPLPQAPSSSRQTPLGLHLTQSSCK